MEISQHLDQTQMTPRVVNNSFRTILDQVFQQDQTFINLPPLPRFFFGKPRVNRWHDFVEQLEIKSRSSDILHQS